MLAARSYLCVPGDCPERFDKAHAAGADAVVIDLEDAVVAQKSAARSHVAAWLAGDKPVIVRINAVGTAWVDDDLKAVRGHALQAVMLPKASSHGDMAYVMRRLPAGTPIIPLIETALAVQRAEEIAACRQTLRLAFGALDFQLETGIEGDEDPLLYARSRLVVASCAAGLLAPIDGVTTSTADAGAVLQDTVRARRLGFGAKLCIHPNQVGAVHEGFAPTGRECSWADRVLGAVAAAGERAANFEGKMIDRPVIERARRIAALAKR